MVVDNDIAMLISLRCHDTCYVVLIAHFSIEQFLGKILLNIPITLSPLIMEVENGCIQKVTTIGGTHFFLLNHDFWEEG